MALTSPPTCPYPGPLKYDNGTDQCCPDYSQNIGCDSTTVKNCLSFNFTTMQCDNGLYPPGQLPWKRGKTHPYLKPWFGTDPPPGGDCTMVNSSPSSAPKLNLDQACADVAGYAGLFLPPDASDPPCEIEGEQVDCYWKRCFTCEGGVVDCIKKFPDPDRGTWYWGAHPEAVWRFGASWEEFGCFLYITGDIVGPDAQPCGGPEPGSGPYRFWLGCPSGFTESCESIGAYGPGNFENAPGTNHRYSYTNLNCLDREYADATPVPITPCPQSTGYIYDAASISFSRTVNAYDRDCCYLTASVMDVCGCFEPLVTGCPPHADTGAGTSGPCGWTCKDAVCPDGYTLDPSLNLCVKPSGWGISFVRSRADGRLVLARVDTSTATAKLVVDRYSDALVDTVEETVQVETGSSTADLSGPVLRAGRDGKFHLFYMLGTTVKLRTSSDGGRTWSAATDQATGANGFNALLDERNGELLLAYHQRYVSAGAKARLKLKVATLDSAGTTWTYGPERVLTEAGMYPLSGQDGMVDFQRLSDGTLSVGYIGNSGTIQIALLKAQEEDGDGAITTVDTAISAVSLAYWLSEHDGMLVIAYQPFSSFPQVKVGTLNTAGTGYTWSTARTIVSATPATGTGLDLHRRGDGTWEFTYMHSTTGKKILRCPNLKSDGTGTWS